MPIVENFLCFDLETGGYAIGVFEVFLHACLITFTGFRLTHSLAHSTFVLTILMGEMVVYSLNLIASVFLIFGTSRSDVRFIFPYLFTSVLVLLTIILSLVSLNWQYIPLFIYTCYSFICILSLCQKIRDEKVQKSVNNYRQAPTRE